MRRYCQKPMIQYRFKDSMGCVFFKNFKTDREARLWYDRNKTAYCIRELGSMGLVYPMNVTHTNMA